METSCLFGSKFPGYPTLYIAATTARLCQTLEELQVHLAGPNPASQPDVKAAMP